MPLKQANSYRIELVSPTGNPVGVIFLNDTFVKATTGKSRYTVTAEDIAQINSGNLKGYLSKCDISIIEAQEAKVIEASAY